MAIGVQKVFTVRVIKPFKVGDTLIVFEVWGKSEIVFYTVTFAAKKIAVGTQKCFAIKKQQKGKRSQKGNEGVK